ncbi:MAG: hypothetical protein V3R54_09095 [Thermodesulfovibrionia bacterium]
MCRPVSPLCSQCSISEFCGKVDVGTHR